MSAKNQPTNKASANKNEWAMQLFRNLPTPERDRILRLVYERLSRK